MKYLTQADVLASYRAGIDNEAIIAILSAITSKMGNDNPVCEILDMANDAIMEIQEAARGADLDAQAAELWDADDKDCRKAQSLLPAASIPSFLTREAA